jgi:hypothetical protein
VGLHNAQHNARYKLTAQHMLTMRLSYRDTMLSHGTQFYIDLLPFNNSRNHNQFIL